MTTTMRKRRRRKRKMRMTCNGMTDISKLVEQKKILV